MTTKCNKVKNPCKICLGSVTNRSGLQCQGACQTWVHYACLNYTPGKIRDIRAGIIKVTCPCPDCKTTMPKEFRTDQPYSCNNSQCPANRPPKCDNHQCPINGRPGRPPPPPCPLNKCGNDCKQFSKPNQLEQSPSNSCAPQPCKPPEVEPNFNDGCLAPKCPSGCSSSDSIAPGYGAPQQMSRPPPPPRAYAPSGGGAAPAMNMNVMEQMCNTVNQLTDQINELMTQMKRGAKDACPPNTPPCGQKGPKENCPKPCFCPGNPMRRN